MHKMKRNIVLTGLPGSGKSTLLKKLITESDYMSAGADNYYGYLTEEIKERGLRIGFKIYPGNQIIAHIASNSKNRVSKYGVEVNTFDAVSENFRKISQDAIPLKEKILFLDEIGQMQLMSDEFKKLVKKFLNQKNICIATLSSVYNNRFTDAIRKRDDVMLIEVTPENREELSKTLPVEIKKLFKMH